MQRWRWAARMMMCEMRRMDGLGKRAASSPESAMRRDAGGSRTLDGAGFIDPPVVHLDESIAAVGEAAIVRGHQQRDAFVGGDVEQKLKDGGAGVLVERAGGLVGEQNFGVVHQRAADGGALAFAAGELLDFLIQPMREAGALGQFVQALVGEGAIGAGGDGGDEAVLCEREIGDEVVKLEDETDLVAQKLEQVAVAIDFDAVDDDAAAVGCVESAEEMQQRAFAATGGSAERDGLALRGFEVDAAENRDGAVVVALPHVFGAEDNVIAASRVVWSRLLIRSEAPPPDGCAWHRRPDRARRRRR